MSTLLYLKTLVKDRNVASITPTSPFGVKKVCRKIHFPDVKAVVEYGPGCGVFTEYLLKKIGPNARIILIEKNPDFVTILKNRFDDPRVLIFNESAENILKVMKECGLSEVDYIISGIPFYFLPPEVKKAILKNTHKALRAGGKFLAYQTFYQTNRQLRDHLDDHFGNVRVEYELLNIPPMRIYETVKKNGHVGRAS